MSYETDCDWMGLQAATLFHHDESGRITGRREPGSPPAPRFFLGRTGHGNVWRLRADLSSTLVRDLSRLAGREPAPRALDADAPPPPPERDEAIRQRLDAVAPVDRAWRGPAFRFPDTPSDRRLLEQRAQETVRIDGADPVLAAEIAAAFDGLRVALDQRLPCYAVRSGADWVSVAYTAAGRGGPALEVGVETAPGHRGRGHAARCVSAWALAVMSDAQQPLFSTSWENHASVALARKLGLVLFGEDVHWS